MEESSIKRKFKAHAKVNLFLAVGKTDRRGYHIINTVFQPLDLADKIIVEKRMDNGIILTSNRKIPLNEKNSAYKAINMMCQEAKKTLEEARLHIHIEKHIPLSSGLGGSAVDAAPVLRDLNERWNIGKTDNELEAIASMIGADVPQALHKDTTYAERYGDQILAHYSLPKRYLCIYVPKEYMSEYKTKTAALYSMIDLERNEERDKAVMVKKCLMKKALENKDWNTIGRLMHNDFEFVAFKKYPFLRKVKELYMKNGAHGALLAGSGGAVFGVFETPEESLRASNVISSSIVRSESGQIILTETI